jgi:type II secretory pathway pseudopilin PulG
MITVWIIGIVILGSLAAYFLGQMYDYDREDYAGPLIGAVIFWPALLIVVAILAPFAIPFILGRRKRNKNKKNA